jgi:excisionase family DNA binding protein
MQKLLCSIPETATALGVSRPTIERMWRDGRIKTVTVGARRLVPFIEIQRLADLADFTGKAAAPVVAEAL